MVIPDVFATNCQKNSNNTGWPSCDEKVIFPSRSPLALSLPLCEKCEQIRQQDVVL